MPAVEIRDLVVRYGAFVAVDGVSFDAHAGEVTAVLGPNGAGKTTTIESAEGYRAPAHGSISVLGRSPQRDQMTLSREIGVMLQSGGVYPTLRASEVLRLFASYYPDAEDPGALLHRLGLATVARTPWRRLSGGEQQRLSMALALVGKPKVVFLDEPTAGVDPTGRLVIREVIRELRDRAVAVLLTTHELAEAEKVADRIVILDHGRIVARGTLDEVLAAGSGQDILFAAPPGIDVASLGAHLGAPVTEVTPGEYRVEAESDPSRVAALTAWLAENQVPLGDLRAGRQRLEDVFHRLTGDSSAETERVTR